LPKLRQKAAFTAEHAQYLQFQNDSYQRSGNDSHCKAKRLAALQNDISETTRGSRHSVRKC